MASTTDYAPAPQNVETSHDSAYTPRGTITASLKFCTPPAGGQKPFDYPGDIEPRRGLPKRKLRRRRHPRHDHRYPRSRIAVQPRRRRIHHSEDRSFRRERFHFGGVDQRRTTTPKSNGFSCSTSRARNVRSSSTATLRRVGGNRPPVLRVHVDRTAAAAIGRVRSLLPDGASTLLRNRVRIVNVWRPLNGPVQRSPPAFADSRTMRDEAPVADEYRYRDRSGETIPVARMDERWCYRSGVDDDWSVLMVGREGGCRIRRFGWEAEGEYREVRALVFG